MPQTITTLPDFSLESAHEGVVCGIDEAGRGPWAGPVVAAAVIWHDISHIPDGLNDSKKLSATKREALCTHIQAHAEWAMGLATVEEIDQLNILAATKLAMQRAYAGLKSPVHVALIDGNQPPKLPCPTQAIIKGDARSLSIAAASIIAKTERDAIMANYASSYPAYGFEKHAGYGTKQHQEALHAHGITPHHRKSFRPIRALLDTQQAS